MSGSSFAQGEGRWRGSAEVYDGEGRFAGFGHDARVVRRRLGTDTVEVEVSFTGPFRLSGRYTITDHGDHRVYGGPLNYGYAEALGDGLIDAHNYWPDIGLSQRFFLMVLPDGDTQLSLALLSRGEQPVYAVVGEYSREAGAGPSSAPDSAHDRSDDPSAGRGAALLDRPGTWSGELRTLDADGGADTTGCTEQVTAVGGDRGTLAVCLTGTGFAGDAEVRFNTDGRHRWADRSQAEDSQLDRAPGQQPEGDRAERDQTPPGTEHDLAPARPVEKWSGGIAVGTESVWGGRALSGSLLFSDGLRLWRREVARLDGSCKGVLHTWYRGGARVGTAQGVLDFEPVDSP